MQNSVIKICTNCNKGYDLGCYKPTRYTGGSYTLVCIKCREKNKISNKKRTNKALLFADTNGYSDTKIICNNCKIQKEESYFVSKTGKRLLKICYSCRNGVKKINNVDHYHIEEVGNNMNKIVPNKFTCLKCKKVFINGYVFNSIEKTICISCQSQS